jgi:ketosteroid isomerase-like protein
MIGTILAKKAVVDTFDALNRHDLPKFMSSWRDDGSFVYPGSIPQSGTFCGRTAVEAWFRRFLEQFAQIHFEIQDVCVRNCFDFVGRNVIAVHFELSLTNREGLQGQLSGVTVITIQGGKALQVVDYIFDTGEVWQRLWGAV